MKYLLLLICCILKLVLASAQDLKPKLINTVWQLTTENYIYSVYYKNTMYEITDYSKSSYPEGGLTVKAKKYGFYDFCELTSINNLKQDGTYYFEVDSTDFLNEETIKVNVRNDCGQLTIFIKERDTLMNIYYSSRQQYATYKKVNALPPDIQYYLKQKGIKLDK